VVVVDPALPLGLAANAVAVLALTLGARIPRILGPDVPDASGHHHPGLIPFGLPVLAAPGADLVRLRSSALAAGLLVVDFPTLGQQTTDYAAFTAQVAATSPADLTYLGVAVHGPAKSVRTLTGGLPLLR